MRVTCSLFNGVRAVMKNTVAFKWVGCRQGLSAVVILMTLLVSSSALASTWAGATGNWSSDGNPGWNGTGIPNGQGAVALFTTPSGTTTQNISGGVTVGTIALSVLTVNDRSIAPTYALTFDQDGAGPGTAIVSNSSTRRISFNTAGAVTMADDLLLVNTGNGTASYSISFSSIIAGSGNLIMNNVANDPAAGPISLTGVNTFTGNVLVKKGATVFTSLGNSANIVTLGSAGNGSATLVSSGSTTVEGHNITVAANSGGTLILGSSETGITESKFTGIVTLNGDLSVTSSKTGAGMVSFTKCLAGVGSVTKIGSGTAVFSGTNNYTGSTTVNTGRLLVNGTTSGQGHYVVNAGGTLGGTGNVGLASGKTVTVAAGGVIAPGNSGVGTLKVNGGFVLGENSTYDWEYKNTTGDVVSITGALSLPAVATVTVTQVSGELPNPMTLVTAGSLSGASNLSGWSVTGKYVAKISGTSVILAARSNPGTVMLIR